MLPDSLRSAIREHLQRVEALHAQDLKLGLGRVWLPGALRVKYPNAEREWIWQYVFPAKSISVDPETKLRRRHHVNEMSLQRAVKAAAGLANLKKMVTPHTLRHSFATHLLENGYELIHSLPLIHPCGASPCGRIPFAPSQVAQVARCRICWGIRMWRRRRFTRM